MDRLRKYVADLEAKAVEASLIADLATDPAARVKLARLVQELSKAIEGLRPDDPDLQYPSAN